MSMYIYIYTYTHTSTYIYTCIYIYVYIHVEIDCHKLAHSFFYWKYHLRETRMQIMNIDPPHWESQFEDIIDPLAEVVRHPWCEDPMKQNNISITIDKYKLVASLGNPSQKAKWVHIGSSWLFGFNKSMDHPPPAGICKAISMFVACNRVVVEISWVRPCQTAAINLRRSRHLSSTKKQQNNPALKHCTARHLL